ncbi:MAG: Bro-N domain-containing protein [Candidatus Omnitrophica bacterium]|nr:Bro-N domain-containing protein [Candidatus Omnitrophota bacterium]
METKIAVFKGRHLRGTMHTKEWWFSVIDVIEILTDTMRPRKYWSDLKQKLIKEGYAEVSEKIGQLKMPAPDGKMRDTDCANTATMLRIVQSIPSPKAEPLKRWLAKVGYERVQEIENPELAMERMRAIYEKKGYPKEWIEKRVRGIAVRQSLTKEWDARGAETDIEYAILTNDIMEGTFGLQVDDYKKLKKLERENLRDHMNDIELILIMLGEATTTKLTKDRDTQGVPGLRKDAQDGGAVAGRTRRDIEKQSGTPVISGDNFLGLAKRKQLKNRGAKKDA